ncbi:MAG TPA: extracellular solute-binding protein [Candidatus Paceibacterota bacterium]
MKDLSLFQVIVLTVSGLLLVIGVIVFATRGGSSRSGAAIGKVVIWGTLDSGAMDNILSTARQTDHSLDQVSYVEKSPATYEKDLINAIAAGTPPDLFVLPQDDLGQFIDKIQLIPYSTISKNSFDSSFVDESQLYAQQNGLIALPLMVDPLVMYINRDIFATGGIATDPVHWSDVLADTPHLTALSGNTVSRSAVAFGLWQNVTNAKEIFSMLVMQAGDPIVVQKNWVPQPVLGANQSGAVENPAEAALRFYTDFANPSKSVYSWNRAQPDSRDAFTAGELAMYFGFASEYQTLLSTNPNLNMSVAMMPQVDGTSVSTTYGNLIGLAVSRNTGNASGAIAVANALTGSADAQLFSSAFHLPSARRDLLASAPANDPIQLVFMRSALIARGFYDPDPQGTDDTFRSMVESVVSGSQTPSDAVIMGGQRFAKLFPLPQQ